MEALTASKVVCIWNTVEGHTTTRENCIPLQRRGLAFSGLMPLCSDMCTSYGGSLARRSRDSVKLAVFMTR